MDEWTIERADARNERNEASLLLAFKGLRSAVIFITAYVADEEAEARAFASGALAYLIKPFDEGDLLRAIHRALKSALKQEG